MHPSTPKHLTGHKKISMKKSVIIFLLCSMGYVYGQQGKEIQLYEKEIPNSIDIKNREQTVVGKDGVTRISKVSIPTLTVFMPKKPNGTSVIICPGGGYSILAFEKEGTLVAREFNKQGIAAFVLKYRLPDDSSNKDRSLAPLQDAQQAILTVRKNAPTWGLNPNRVGIMGFSAGGHLAATASTHFKKNAGIINPDSISLRPDFSILLYPVISFDSSIAHKGSRDRLVGSNPSAEKINDFSNELQVSSTTAPTFLVHAGNDQSVPVENSIRYYQACIKNKVPAEMHLYPAGGHGFGMFNKTTRDNWVERMFNWIADLK
jgi:acetyl esterase/lipase